MLLKSSPLCFVLILVFICAAAVLLSNQAEAKTWYVDDDGGADFEKIQDAVNASEDGDTIRVFGGTYYEYVVVNKTVSLVGNGSANTTINGGGVGDAVEITVDWVNLSGFGIQNSGHRRKDAGIKVQSNNTTITNNTITSNKEDGIYLYFSNNTTISNTTISNNNMGISLHSSNNNTITGNTISNNTISNNTRYGINAKSNNKYTTNATNNWWGNDSGPYHPSKNPTGKGNNVSDYVDFSPWRDEEGNEVYVPPKEKDKKGSISSGFSILLFIIIIIILCLLVVVVKLPDSSRPPAKPSEVEKQLPPQPPQRINTCPHCGGKFEVTSEKRPIIFNCHFCGKEIEFK